MRPRWCALVALSLLSGCERDHPFRTVAVYEAPRSGYTIRMEANGVVPSGADMSEESSAVLTLTKGPGAGAASPVTIHMALREGRFRFGDDLEFDGIWHTRSEEALTNLLSNAGFLFEPEELTEVLSAAEGVLLGPKGTLMSGQAKALRVVSVKFDR
jgi:hypothetical protein